MMKRLLIRVVFLMLGNFLVVVGLSAQTKKARRLFDQKNLFAWCIVPFDIRNRDPEERIAMLKRLKFSQYAYDWRHQHLDSFAAEINLARKEQVSMVAVWIWIDKNTDKPGQLSEDNERMLGILKDAGIKTQLWVGFNHNYFEDGDDAARVNAGVEMVRYLRLRTAIFVTTVGLYNHGDWFGDPLNQVTIVKALDDPQVGIVYNFHHGHTQINNFSMRVKAMMPYLIAVNINGMKASGPQILPVGTGESEKDMLSILLENGYAGPIGILGHIESEDVEVVLQRNLKGLRQLEKSL
jgi:sugar phosphate isomerase/epimerase